MTTSSFRDLSPLLNPRALAVVGASEQPGSPGRTVLENLRHLGYRGAVYPVNPKYDQILGLPCYPDLGSLPGPVDAAAILLSADKVLPSLEAAVAAGARAAWSLAIGFAEAGPEGKARQDELARFAQETGLLLCGPNCIGLANLVDGVAMYSVALSPAARPGGVSVVSQSGAICMGIANAVRFGFRHLISSGNEAVLDSADYIGYLAGDPHTQVIVTFLEGVRSPQKFIRAARAAARAGKPILALKVGRSAVARRAVQAHTGSLAGSDAVYDAVFHQLGVMRLETVNELLETAKLFVTCPLPEGEGMGILSLSGGQVGLLADLAQDLGIAFPPFSQEARRALAQILPPAVVANPLDAWGVGDLERIYPACVEVVAREPHIHLIALSRDTPAEAADPEVEQSLLEAQATVRAAQKTDKPVLMFSIVSAGFRPEVEQMLEKGNVPYLQGARETLRAMQTLVRYADFCRRMSRERTEGDPVVGPSDLKGWREKLAATRGALSEIEGRRLLSAYGISGPREAVASNAEEAVQAAQRIGYPVVLKVLSPDIQHKTEIGGVRVGLKSREDVSGAFEQVMEVARGRRPEARLEGVLIQEMVPPESVEVILGVLRDPDFGPAVVFGSGGVLVELVQDSALRLPPLSQEDALEMIHETRGSALLRGFRGKPPADLDALVDTILRLSQLAVDLGDVIAALDINPLMVLPQGQGVRAVDALVECSS